MQINKSFSEQMQLLSDEVLSNKSNINEVNTVEIDTAKLLLELNTTKKFNDFCSLMQESKTKEEIMLSLHISKRTYYYYLKEYNLVKNLWYYNNVKRATDKWFALKVNGWPLLCKA